MGIRETIMAAPAATENSNVTIKEKNRFLAIIRLGVASKMYKYENAETHSLRIIHYLFKKFDRVGIIIIGKKYDSIIVRCEVISKPF